MYFMTENNAEKSQWKEKQQASKSQDALLSSEILECLEYFILVNH